MPCGDADAAGDALFGADGGRFDGLAKSFTSDAGLRKVVGPAEHDEFLAAPAEERFLRGKLDLSSGRARMRLSAGQGNTALSGSIGADIMAGSLIKTGEKARLDEMALDALKAYAQQAAAAPVKPENVAGLKAFQQRMVREGNPSTAALTKTLGKEGAEAFFRTVVMPV